MHSVIIEGYQLSVGLDEIHLVFILSFLLILHSQSLKLHFVYYQHLIASPFYGSFFKHERTEVKRLTLRSGKALKMCEPTNTLMAPAAAELQYQNKAISDCTVLSESYVFL